MLLMKLKCCSVIETSLSEGQGWGTGELDLRCWGSWNCSIWTWRWWARGGLFRSQFVRASPSSESYLHRKRRASEGMQMDEERSERQVRRVPPGHSPLYSQFASNRASRLKWPPSRQPDTLLCSTCPNNIFCTESHPQKRSFVDVLRLFQNHNLYGYIVLPYS